MGHSKKKLIKRVNEIPAFPQNVYRVLELTSDVNCAPRDLLEVVEHDPVLTLRFLTLVNAPDFGLLNQTSSIKQALVFAGVNTLKNLALCVSPLKVFPRTSVLNEPPDPLLNALLRHAMMTAVIARHLARNMGVSEVEVSDYFVAGLLHDFGQVVFAYCHPKRFQRAINDAAEKKVPLIQVEKSFFGWNHAELGAHVGEKCCLPDKLIACMRDHHTRVPQESTPLHDCVYTANLLACMLDSGYFDPHAHNEKLPEAIVHRFGLELSGVWHALGDVSEEMSKIHDFL